MKISLKHISKRYQRHWVFKDVNITFEAPGAYALLGANGSGKSTLLRIIGGLQNASAGKLLIEGPQGAVPVNGLFPFISFCAPGMELPEELTFREVLQFHFTFKRPLPGLTTGEIIRLTGLAKAADQPIGDYSSGMRQRVKLAQAICSDTPVLLLDEPATNLDEAGVHQYREWMERYAAGRLVIIASNDEREYRCCKERLVMEAYK